MTAKKTARIVLRFATRAATIAMASIAVGIVWTFSVDLGPRVKAWAESAVSKQIQRPVHIGRLAIRLFDGRVVAHDLRIEGLSPADDPFFDAKEIAVTISWWPLLRRQFVIESIKMQDWRMTAETFPGGRHSFPRFTSNQPGKGRGVITFAVRYVHAWRGQFTYQDRGTPWSAVVRNLDVTVVKVAGYRGLLRSSGGVVRIQRYEPMAAGLNTWFRIDNGKILLDRIELETDGAQTRCTGVVDFRHWPEQRYEITSLLQLPRMREIFWAHDTFSLVGVARFTGAFHVFAGGRQLTGTFSSEEAGLNQYRFPALDGALVWTRDKFEVTRARSQFYGGTTRFTYLMAPFGQPAPTRARFDASYDNVDLATFTNAMQVEGLRLSGRARGHTLLEWPLGRFAEHRGHGDAEAQPPPGVALQGRALPNPPPVPSFAHVYGDPFPPLGHVPIGGALHYQFGPEWIDLAPSRLATPTTFVEFQGRTAFGERSVIPFHVTSSEWQESDRLLAGIMTAFGSPTRPVEMGGAGVFDGVLLNAFRTPRIEGLFVATRMRAWDVEWGSGQSQITVENAYLDVKGAVVRKDGGEIQADGRFSLGYPRKDGGEQMNARMTTRQWKLAELRHAFDLDEYPVDGKLSGEFHVYGAYTGPFGFGRVTISPGTAYGETLADASAALRFEGTGVRFDGLEIHKSTGTILGAAHVGWDGTYSFNVDGRSIPIESIDVLKFPQAPPTGQFEFSAGGSGRFAYPTFDVRGRFRDVFVRDEGIGLVTGLILVRGEDVNFEFKAASPRLEVSGSGRVTTLGDYPGEVTLRVTDTSIDPYARLFGTGLSPFATAVATGTLRVSGTLANSSGLVAQARIDDVTLRLFDYELRNNGPIDIGFDQDTLRVNQLQLAGENTRLGVSGTVDLARREIGIHADGEANLGILQAFFKDIRSSGRARVTADVTGEFDRPQVGGSAVLTDGRLRHMWLPHAIEGINGTLAFAGSNIRFDDVKATVGKGAVRFGGRIGLKGLWPTELDLTASGEGMELRFPAGFRSLVDAELALRGSMEDPLLSGTVSVRSALLKRRFDIGSGLVELAGTATGTSPAASTPASAAFPLRFDVRIVAPSSLQIDNNLARITSSADLTLRGDLNKPLLFGRAEVERGEVWFEGRRIAVTRGTIDFSNPARIEPYFDVEAETRLRSPGQTYQVTLRATGTLQHFDYQLMSDPPLPEVDILSMLLGDVNPTQDADVRALRSPNSAEQSLYYSRAARLLASPISSNVQRVVEQTFGIDTFQLTPLVSDPYQQSGRFTPGARLTIGKRISDRVYLTYSRSLTSASRDQIILLEYDQSDRLSWIVTQNEDRTYALDVRVRHVFR